MSSKLPPSPPRTSTPPSSPSSTPAPGGGRPRSASAPTRPAAPAGGGSNVDPASLRNSTVSGSNVPASPSIHSPHGGLGLGVGRSSHGALGSPATPPRTGRGSTGGASGTTGSPAALSLEEIRDAYRSPANLELVGGGPLIDETTGKKYLQFNNKITGDTFRVDFQGGFKDPEKAINEARNMICLAKVIDPNTTEIECSPEKGILLNGAPLSTLQDQNVRAPLGTKSEDSSAKEELQGAMDRFFEQYISKDGLKGVPESYFLRDEMFFPHMGELAAAQGKNARAQQELRQLAESSAEQLWSGKNVSPAVGERVRNHINELGVVRELKAGNYGYYGHPLEVLTAAQAGTCPQRDTQDGSLDASRIPDKASEAGFFLVHAEAHGGGALGAPVSKDGQRFVPQGLIYRSGVKPDHYKMAHLNPDGSGSVVDDQTGKVEHKSAAEIQQMLVGRQAVVMYAEEGRAAAVSSSGKYGNAAARANRRGKVTWANNSCSRDAALALSAEIYALRNP